MATAASSAANSASLISQYSVDSSVSRSRRDSSPWMASGDSVAFHDHRAPSVTQEDPPTGNGDKKPVWNKPSSSSSDVGPVMGAASWPSLPVSGRASSSKSPSLEGLSDGTSSSPSPSPTPMQAPQVAGTQVNSSGGIESSVGNANAAENHNVNGQRKPFFRRNNTAFSNSSNPPPNAGAREENHNQRGGGTQFRNSNKNRSSYPRGDRRSYEQSGFSHGNGRGFGVMMMGPPSFAASSAQYMAATQYGGPMLYQGMFMPPDAIALVGGGQFQPLPLYLPSVVDATILYSKILTQVEYYFSADNLSRDQYLRSCMNDEGWVPVRIIAGFRKLAELTNNIQTIVEALRSSQVVEVKGETIRRRGDWDKYLLPSSRSGPPSAATSGNNASLG